MGLGDTKSLKSHDAVEAELYMRDDWVEMAEKVRAKTGKKVDFRMRRTREAMMRIYKTAIHR
jgi:hypothetical protein